MSPTTHRHERTINLNGQTVVISLQDDKWWIAIRPICKALNVSYERQRIKILRHPILSKYVGYKEFLAKDQRLREMVCLPEQYVYGWLLSLNVKSEQLITYQEQLYDALYSYFHLTITTRITALQLRDETNREITDLEEQLERELSLSETFTRMQELKSAKKKIETNLKEIDSNLLLGQLPATPKEEQA